MIRVRTVMSQIETKLFTRNKIQNQINYKLYTKGIKILKLTNVINGITNCNMQRDSWIEIILVLILIYYGK